MFFSKTLLTATGALASVWLSSNQEKKVSKNQVIQHNVQKSVNAIMEPQEEAPLSLRLSGQLLYGVVRIYGRKARYLLDDCNEAIMKIKMAFRPNTGNIDLPANLPPQAKTSMMLPDRLTVYDDLGSLPPVASQIEDLSATPIGRKTRSDNRDINLQEDTFTNSQYLTDTQTNEEDELAFGDMDLDLGLDLGLDMPGETSKAADRSVEVGRDAPPARPVEEDMLSELAGPSKDRGVREPSMGMDLDFGERVQIADNEGNVRMQDEGDIRMQDDDDFRIAEPSILPMEPSITMEPSIMGMPDPTRERISESPLSDIDEDYARQVELEFRHRNSDLYEPDEDTATTVTAPQRSRKRKFLQPDEATTLPGNMIKEQQSKRHNMLREPSFIPGNPRLLALLEQQKNGSFVKFALFDGQADDWAPELRGLLSLDAVRPDDRKRKRDSGIADMESDQDPNPSKSPRLELPEDETVLPLGGAPAGGPSMAQERSMLELPGDDENMPRSDDTRESGSLAVAFDETAAPQVHPADSGPISIGTKHAVHILRDLFGEEAATNDEVRKQTSVVFQELLPEQRTTKADATKMFFECLVLATKDAIKVEQAEGSLGGPIRVRGKRGLWGAWAEREAGGEIARDQDEQEQDAVQNNPAHAVASAPAVSVSA